MTASRITLIVAEKPSVGRDIARVLGARTRRDGYLEGPNVWVSWCIGHLVELCEPHEYDPAFKNWSPRLLPILPEQFKIRPSRAGKKQLRVLRSLLGHRDVATVVNACDAGREGELIFRYVYELTRCTKPVRRLWISSLTPQAIRQGMDRLRPGSELDPLADAARCRAEADWMVGMNATRALTGLVRRGGGGRQLMSVGRVQTPTLALIVRREQEIEAFVPETYWQVQATFDRVSDMGRYDGLWHRPRHQTGLARAKPDRHEERAQTSSVGKKSRTPLPLLGKALPADSRRGAQEAEIGESPLSARARADSGKRFFPNAARLATRDEAEAIAAAVNGQPGRVARVEHKTVRERPPLLYDLTALQKAANRRHGMSAKRTLTAAQALYERHKAITYPRTDSRHLTSDMAAELPGILDALDQPNYRQLAQDARARGVPRGKRMIDNSEVSDHHAIIPTAKTVDLDRLGDDERRIYDLVARRFIAGFLADAVFAKTVIETAVVAGGVEHRFISRGRVCTEPGWQAAEPAIKSQPSKPQRGKPQRGKSRKPEPRLPAVAQGEAVHTAQARTREGQTEPPKRYSEARLLAAMETAGRDVDDESLRRALKDAGMGTPATRAAIIETLLKRDYVRRKGKLLQPTASGRALIAAMPVDDLLSAVLTGAWEQKLADIARGRSSRPQFIREVRAFTASIVAAIAGAEPPMLESGDAGGPGKAEVLGRCPVCQSAVTEGFKAYSCATGKTCSFVIFKRIAGRTISPALVRVLLGRRQSQVLKGFRSKRGKRFAAALAVGDDGKVTFVFESSGMGKSQSVTAGAGSSDSQGQSKDRGKDRRRSVAKSRPAKAPRCPACRQGQIIAGNRGWGCSRWREMCRFVVWFHHNDFRVPEDEAERLFRRGQTRLMDGLSPHGRARLVLDLAREGNVRIELGKRGGKKKS